MSNEYKFPRTENFLKTRGSEDDIQKPKEMVNHPKHYNVGSIEAIELIEDQGLGEAFCAGNVMKYIMRYKSKGTPLEDLKKVKWYTERLISYYENK